MSQRDHGRQGFAVQPQLRPNRGLTEFAQEVADRALPLLPPQAGLILGVELDCEDAIHLYWWGRDMRLVASLSAPPEGFCPEASAEGALQRAGVKLLAYLARRWPAPPERLGVVTDGTGIVFAADHPAPSEANWLLRHAGGAGSLRTILPLSPVGPCAMLVPVDATTH